MRKFVFASIIVLLFFAASMASAYTVQLAYTGVSNGAAVTLAGKLTGNGYLAGNYTANITNNMTNYGSFTGFCVDWAAANSPNVYSPYNLVGIAEDSRYEAAAWVMANYSTPTYGYSAAAAQIAIWELVWDWNNTNLAAGNLIYSGIYSADATELITDALAGRNSFDQSNYMIALSPATDDSLGYPYQDFIFRRTVPIGGMVSAPVPIPPAAYLFSAGLIGLIGVRRRFQK
jgi:hypothetical protein